MIKKELTNLKDKWLIIVLILILVISIVYSYFLLPAQPIKTPSEELSTSVIIPLIGLAAVAFLIIRKNKKERK
ncbi:MAG: hypothetical protein Q8O39_00405 [bacterium]|nr:hypothetical protein [bacterium]